MDKIKAYSIMVFWVLMYPFAALLIFTVYLIDGLGNGIKEGCCQIKEIGNPIRNRWEKAQRKIQEQSSKPQATDKGE